MKILRTNHPVHQLAFAYMVPIRTSGIYMRFWLGEDLRSYEQAALSKGVSLEAHIEGLIRYLIKGDDLQLLDEEPPFDDSGSPG